ncbi:MAG: hypothetical protein U1F71_23115 [Verrucomicrobiaceae bacterium]
MKAPLPTSSRCDHLALLVARLNRGDKSALPALEPLIADAECIRLFGDEELKDLILIVKHHRPDLALVLLTHVKTPQERQSLGNCLAALWSRIDINAAWRAISASSLPESERLAMRSVMV